MSEAAASGEHTIDAALRGPVLDILVANIPVLQAMERDLVFSRVLNNPDLADACFRFFRAKPALFQPVLLDANGEATKQEDVMLSCGRTLSEAIAMVVRAVAKRHFRAYFKPKTNSVKKPPPKPSLLKSILQFGATKPPLPRSKPKAPHIIRADAVYEALSAFLLFEWQLTLIPYYAPIPVGTLSALGARILSFHDASQLEVLLKVGPEEAMEMIERSAAEGSEKLWTEIGGEPQETPADAENWELIIIRNPFDK